MSSVRLTDTWRTTTFRLVLLYGSMFAAGVIAMLALIYYHTAHYIDQQIDQILEAELRSFRITPIGDLHALIAGEIERDARHIEIFGLFAPDGRILAGNIRQVPAVLPADGLPHSLKVGPAVTGKRGSTAMRGLIAVLPGQHTLVLGREEQQIEEIRNIIFQALQGAVLVIVVGTLVGIRLSQAPIRRIREVQRVSQQIINGEIGLRLPVSSRDDELDMLASIVNRMLDEIEQRMLDIKGVSDSIAHNLRTPLTRLRAMLNRLLQSTQGSGEHAVVEQAIDEADHLLARFRALLRISEISGSMRRAAFEKVDLKAVLQNIQDVYAPVAEEKDVAFELILSREPAEVLGDGALLFEAVLNLVDNAIKFTPPGGYVQVRLDPGPVIKIEDNGPGIPKEELNMVTQPFFRGEAGRNLPGSGVGLSIVGAIANLHGFHFGLTSGEGGTCASLRCVH